MEREFESLDDRQLLAVIDAALTALTDQRLRLPTDREQLDLVLGSLRVDARLHAWQQQLLGRVEKAEAAWHEHKTSTTTWLAEAGNLTPREARRMVRAGQELLRFPVVAAGANAGDVLSAQAEAITSVLRELPAEFPAQTLTDAQELMVGFAAEHNSAELRRLTGHLLEVLAPEAADALEEKRLERQQRQAMTRRFLEFCGDGQGSVLIRGSLPVAAAEPFIRIVDAYAEAEKRALDAIDPLAEPVSPAMRRADALVAMANAHAQEALAPTYGGDRPRAVITLSYDKLVQQCVDAGLAERCAGGVCLIGSGEPLAPSAARQLLCDADVLPVVLGGASEVLDVGRTQRLVTPAIRAALELRDRGCVFPGCDKPPAACHAHHIKPWWAGGVTALHNLVLVCPHHHGIVEPGRDPTADRWPSASDPTELPRSSRPSESTTRNDLAGTHGSRPRCGAERPPLVGARRAQDGRGSRNVARGGRALAAERIPVSDPPGRQRSATTGASSSSAASPARTRRSWPRVQAA